MPYARAGPIALDDGYRSRVDKLFDCFEVWQIAGRQYSHLQVQILHFASFSLTYSVFAVSAFKWPGDAGLCRA
jgi:hypothetical protein